jgi:type II secretory pathway pseudopilin PulG
MAIDNKYGRIEFPDADWVTIEPDEPVFILRGRDVIAPEVIKEYRKRAVEAGSPEHHLRMVDESLRKFKQWQQKVSVVPTSNDWLKAQTQDPTQPQTQDPRDNPQVAEDNKQYFEDQQNPNPMTNPNTEPLETTDSSTQYVAPSATTSIKDQESTESAEGVESSEDEESAQDLLAIFENGEKGTTGK